MLPLNCNKAKILLAIVCAFLFILHQPVHGRTVAFFYALEDDLNVLHTLGTAEKVLQLGNRKASRIRIQGITVFAIKMNSGSVETAVSAQALLSMHRVDLAFSTGPAGALGKKIKPNQWFAIQSCLAYQAGSYTPSGHVLPEPDLRLQSPEGLDLPLASIISGELFVGSSIKKEELANLTGADLIDMNTIGLLAACGSHKIPLYCIRVASDRADDQAKSDFAAFIQEYKGDGSRLFVEWLKKLPPDPTDPTNHPHLEKLLNEK